jgi:Uma2 family endonuclease
VAIVQAGLTQEEFLKLPDQKPALEYLDGVVTQKMAAKGPHGTLQFVLAKWLDRAGGEGESAWVMTETHAHWPQRASLVPDISVYLIGRVPLTADGEIVDDLWAPPDIAVEIASPGQSVNDLTARAATLTGLGVRVVMVVEPRLRRVRLARPGRPIVTYQGDDLVTIEDVLPDVAFTVRDLFASLSPRRPGSGPAR